MGGGIGGAVLFGRRERESGIGKCEWEVIDVEVEGERGGKEDHLFERGGVEPGDAIERGERDGGADLLQCGDWGGEVRRGLWGLGDMERKVRRFMG